MKTVTQRGFSFPSALSFGPSSTFFHSLGILRRDLDIVECKYTNSEQDQAGSSTVRSVLSASPQFPVLTP